MRLLLRAIPAAAMVGAFIAPPAQAGWSCTYYKWNTTVREWDRVALMQDEDLYEAQPGNKRFESWDCKYCYVPTLTVGPDHPAAVTAMLEDGLHQGEQLAAGTVEQVESTLAAIGVDLPSVEIDVTPFPEPPDCPLVPPERLP